MRKIGVAFGRFNSLTREHQKLLDGLNELDAEHKFIFVFGANEAPLSHRDRLIYVRWCYPKINVYSCTDEYCHNIPSAIINLYQHFPNHELHLFGGQGKTGILEKSKVGGSITELERIVENMQGTHFRTEPCVFRMNWESVKYHPIQRGKWSGSEVRKFMRTLDFNKSEDVESLMPLLHSKMGFEETWRILMLFNKGIV